MKKFFLLFTIFACALSLNAINEKSLDTNESNATMATVAYIDLSSAVTNSDNTIVTADVISSTSTSLTFRFILTGGTSNRVAYYNYNGFETTLSGGSGQIQKEVRLSVPQGRSQIQIRLPKSQGYNQIAVANIIQPDGSTVSPLVLSN